MDTTFVSEAYEAYRDQLHGYLMSLTHDREAAEDLLQETYSRLLREVHAGRSPRHTRAWLYQVGRNLAISRGRRLQVAQRSSEAWQPAPVDGSAEEHFLLREAGGQLHALLGELEPTDRLALLMAAEGYSGAEIARTVGRTENCVRTRMCRARMRLRTRLLALEGRQRDGTSAQAAEAA